MTHRCLPSFLLVSVPLRAMRVAMPQLRTRRAGRPDHRPCPRAAQKHQITQIVIGSSQRSRWQQITGGGSKVARIIREAGSLGIDVHVIALRNPRRHGTAGPGYPLVARWPADPAAADGLVKSRASSAPSSPGMT
jgi:hypothetical protein